jgi:hypothetical protein
MEKARLDLMRQFRKSPHRRTPLSQIGRVFDLASQLGRKARGMPLGGAVSEPQPSPPSGLDFEAALQNSIAQQTLTRHESSMLRARDCIEWIALNGAFSRNVRNLSL